MNNKTETNGNKTKILAAIIGAVVTALITSTAGMMYRHEVSILEQERDISKVRARLYRERVRQYEYHERFMRGAVQLVELRGNKEGLSIVDKSILAFYKSQQELVQEEKDNYIETWKHEGQ